MMGKFPIISIESAGKDQIAVLEKVELSLSDKLQSLTFRASKMFQMTSA